MAVTAHRIIIGVFALTLQHTWADEPADVRAQLEVVATALTAGNPSDAMAPFDKSYANHDKLSAYFGGLTSAFQIVNEVDVSDEEDSAEEAKVTLNWAITLADLGTKYTERRVGEIKVRLVLRGRQWKIVDFGPIEIFDPQPKPWPKPPLQ